MTKRADVPIAAAQPLLQRRVLWIVLLALLLGLAATVIAKLLLLLIGLITNLAFYARWSTVLVNPGTQLLGPWVILVPIAGGIIVGLMARYGHAGIRGHGIPEAMEQILLNESRIAPSLTLLKPLSSAISIGTGGPFGAEGPIIATGGALGSLIGQWLHVSADERKTLLAAGAAAGMAAIFGTPVAAVLLAIELLLFERRARSLIPVAVAAVAAIALRAVLIGSAPMFPMPHVAVPGAAALLTYGLIGLLVGLASIAVTALVYAVEDGFARLPIHWMWWPALGGLVVGVVGYLLPDTLGVGYSHIDAILGGRLGLAALIALCLLKLLSWAIALGSGTSGGTLAPLFIIGGALGGVLGAVAAQAMPWLHLDPGLAALVGMAAMFTGASRAFMTSVVFALEVTHQPHALPALLGGCALAYLVSALLMRTTIMSEKIERRGVRVPENLNEDFLARMRVEDACAAALVTLPAAAPVADTARWLRSAQAGTRHVWYPLQDTDGQIIGVVSSYSVVEAPEPASGPLRELPLHPVQFIAVGASLREAADRFVDPELPLLVVVGAQPAATPCGVLTRSDVLAAHAQRLREAQMLR